jgi:hypothetical protein
VLLEKTQFDGVLAELRGQGLKVTSCSVLNETWYIKDDDALFTGYREQRGVDQVEKYE